MKLNSIVFAPLLTLLMGMVAHSAEHMSPRTAALGGAGRAAPLLNDATYQNSSYMAFIRKYAFGAHYLTFDGTDGSGYYGRSYNLSVQDGRSPNFQAGVGYTVREGSKTITVGTAKAIGNPNLARRVALGASYNRVMELGDRTLNQIGANMTWLASKTIQFSFNADNLFENEGSRQYNRYREFIVGSKFNISNRLLIYLDPHYTPSLDEDTAWGYQAGVELVAFKDLYLRYGNFRNASIPFMDTYGSGWAAGIGWMAPKLSLDYAFTNIKSNLSGLPPAESHSLSATLFF